MNDYAAPTETTEPTEPKLKRQPFRELTLWQVLWLLIYHPGATLQRFFTEISLPLEDEEEATSAAQPAEIDLPAFLELDDRYADYPANLPPARIEAATEVAPVAPVSVITVPEVYQPGLMVAGMAITLILALIGANRLWDAAIDPAFYAQNNTNGAFFWFFLAGLTYVIMMVTGYMWRPASPPPVVTAPAEPVQPVPAQTWQQHLIAIVERHSVRMALIPVALVLAYLAFTQNIQLDPNTENVISVQLTTGGAAAWLLAIALWFGILAVDIDRGLLVLYRRMNGQERVSITWPDIRVGWQHLILAVILLAAAYFRFHDLSGVPPEMTSDHIEKLLDALKVYEGQRPIFLANNGGREAFQMYYIAALASVFNLEFSFDLLKIASGIEGMITVALAFWFGQVMVGKQHRQLGIWVGLAMAALIAVSAWHTMLSRLGLRIVLTPLSTMLVTIFLVHGLRDNRRLDFVIAGFWLGTGFYFYQANRMLPLMVVAGTFLAIALRARTKVEVGRYLVNLLCAGIMAIVIFLPLYRYQLTYPADFWNRTRGRIYGEDAFFRTNPETGRQEAYQPSLQEQIDRFAFDKFDNSYWEALKMWSWKGDGLWISNPGSRPAFDLYTNGLLMVGIVAWIVLMFRQRDVGHWLVPAAIIIMLLPTAMTLAFPGENPSFTRASGTLPFVYLLAAYPLAQLAYYLTHLPPQRMAGVALAVGVAIPLLALSARSNHHTYFDLYPAQYAISWGKPYSEFATPLRNFAEGEGSYGNAFVIAWPHWLDHRILGTIAGDIKWNNGLVNRQDVYSFLLNNEGTPYQYDPNKPLFFMYHPLDVESRAWLQQRFPGGTEYAAPITDRPDLTFYYYIAPPGYDWLNAMVQEETIEQGCVLDC